MKKFEILGVISIVLIVTLSILGSIALFIFGGITANEQIIRAGVMVLVIGFPLSILVVVIVLVILSAMGKFPQDYRYSDNAAVSEDERDFKRNKNANHSRRNKSIAQQVDDVIRDTNNAHKYSSPKQIILGGLFFAFLIIDFMLILIFSIKQITAGIITCACVLVGSMFLALIIAKVNERKSIKAKVDISNSQMLCGEVKACMVSSTANIVGKCSINFRVLIDGENGITYTAYSKNIYEKGATVVFAVIGNGKASIVDNDKFMQETENILKQDNDKDSL